MAKCQAKKGGAVLRESPAAADLTAGTLTVPLSRLTRAARTVCTTWSVG